MRQSNDNTVEIEAVIRHETKKAYLIDHGGEEEVWIPKSQVLDIIRGPKSVILIVTEWIAYEKGLI